MYKHSQGYAKHSLNAHRLRPILSPPRYTQTTDLHELRSPHSVKFRLDIIKRKTGAAIPLRGRNTFGIETRQSRPRGPRRYHSLHTPVILWWNTDILPYSLPCQRCIKSPNAFDYRFSDQGIGVGANLVNRRLTLTRRRLGIP